MKSTTGTRACSRHRSTARRTSATVCPRRSFRRTASLPDWAPKWSLVLERYLRNKGERLGADKFRADLARERTKEDLVPARPEQVLDLVPPRMESVRTVGKRIGRDEPRLPVPVREPGNPFYRPVPHAVAEDLGCLAVPAGMRAPPGDLDIAFHLRECRIAIGQDARRYPAGNNLPSSPPGSCLPRHRGGPRGVVAGYIPLPRRLHSPHTRPHHAGRLLHGGHRQW